jgi:hypothetical protein
MVNNDWRGWWRKKRNLRTKAFSWMNWGRLRKRQSWYPVPGPRIGQCPIIFVTFSIRWICPLLDPCRRLCLPVRSSISWINWQVIPGVQSASWLDINFNVGTSYERAAPFDVLLSTWCRAAAFFSASGAALSQEVPTVKWMSNQLALWTPCISHAVTTFASFYRADWLKR